MFVGLVACVLDGGEKLIGILSTPIAHDGTTISLNYALDFSSASYTSHHSPEAKRNLITRQPGPWSIFGNLEPL